MPPRGYRSVSLSEAILDEAETLLKELAEKGFQPYTNITVFVADSVRRRNEELRQLYLNT